MDSSNGKGLREGEQVVRNDDKHKIPDHNSGKKRLNIKELCNDEDVDVIQFLRSTRQPEKISNVQRQDSMTETKPQPTMTKSEMTINDSIYYLHSTHRPNVNKHHPQSHSTANQEASSFLTKTGKTNNSMPTTTKSVISPQFSFHLNHSDANLTLKNDTISKKRTLVKQCSRCGTLDTPSWRKSVTDETLCNACGLYEKINKRPRKFRVNADGSLRVRRVSSATSRHSERSCQNCKVTSTPLWRRIDDIYYCNACGIFYRANGYHRSLTINMADEHEGDGDGNNKGLGIQQDYKSIISVNNDQQEQDDKEQQLLEQKEDQKRSEKGKNMEEVSSTTFSNDQDI